MRPAGFLLGLAALAALAPAGATDGDGSGVEDGVMLHVQKVGDGDYRYIPAEADVYAGSGVVLGHVFAQHSLTSVPGGFNSTGDASGWPSIRAPDEPGAYRFYCWLHATPDTLPEEGMAGVLRVHARPGAGAQGTAEPAAADAGPAQGSSRSPTATGATGSADVPGPAAVLVALAGLGAALLGRRRA